MQRHLLSLRPRRRLAPSAHHDHRGVRHRAHPLDLVRILPRRGDPDRKRRDRLTRHDTSDRWRRRPHLPAAPRRRGGKIPDGHKAGVDHPLQRLGQRPRRRRVARQDGRDARARGRVWHPAARGARSPGGARVHARRARQLHRDGGGRRLARYILGHAQPEHDRRHADRSPVYGFAPRAPQFCARARRRRNGDLQARPQGGLALRHRQSVHRMQGHNRSVPLHHATRQVQVSPRRRKEAPHQREQLLPLDQAARG